MSQNYQLKYSCADFTFPLLSQRQMLELLRLLKFDAVDLGVFAGRAHIHPQDIQADPERAAGETRRVLSDHGLAVSDVFLQTGEHPGVNAANDPDMNLRRALRETFEATVVFASSLGCKHITGLPGVPHEGVSDEYSFGVAAEEAMWRVQTAKQSGVTYSVEAHVGSICPDPQTALALVKQVEGLTLTLDYTHFICAGISNEGVHQLLPWASHFHARAARVGQLQSILHENEVDYRAITDWMRRHRYPGFVCLEYVWLEWMGCNRTDNISETILLREYLRHLMVS